MTKQTNNRTIFANLSKLCLNFSVSISYHVIDFRNDFDVKRFKFKFNFLKLINDT